MHVTVGGWKLLCNICGSETKEFDHCQIIGKNEITYYRCSHCGYICTEKPYWLKEAYSDAIADSDIGLLARNYRFQQTVPLIIHLVLSSKENNSFLDYGAGYGVFVRLMRDRGYDFEWYDKYCDNIFAKGHEKTKDHYTVITGFELAEHLADPINELGPILRMCDHFIFSTSAVSFTKPPKVNDWWYYAVDSGQHVSFYTKRSFQILAEKFGMHYYHFVGSMHLISKKKISTVKFWTTKVNYFRKLALIMIKERCLLSRRKSLQPDDYLKITGKMVH